jgi:hypothetical protein
MSELYATMDEYLWHALYQQSPVVEGGGMLKRHR